MYEDNHTPLRELKEGERFLTKGNLELYYISDLGDDKHRVCRLDGSSWDVPHGNFPSFKYKVNE
tara:strand:+ start:622 stop:813 length:192 start_codon:yes stop_codon:yes gene_type:complete